MMLTSIASPIAAARCALKPAYRQLAYRVLTAMGRNHTGIDRSRWSQNVSIARTQRDLRRCCRILETDAGLMLIDTPLGRFWIPQTEPDAFDGFLLMVAEELNNHYQFEGAAYVLDCGANIGTFTRLALNRGATVVVAIEPAPDMVRCLRKTFASEIAAGRVKVEERGLWNEDDTLFLRTSSYSWNNTVLKVSQDVSGVPIPLTTLDNIVTDAGLPAVDFIKMDVEGAESRALKGAGATLRRWNPVISVAVEHTADKFKNAAAVVAVSKEFAPYSEMCIKGSVMRSCSILGLRLPSSVVPEIILLRSGAGREVGREATLPTA